MAFLRYLGLVAFTLISLCWSGCQEEEVEFQTNECKKQPAFIRGLGFNPNRSAFSTSEKNKKGLILMELNPSGDTSQGGRKMYQHPSWQMAGWLGPLQVDPEGNCYVAPVPMVNVLDNPTEKQHHIYRVDANTGEMTEFMQLPLPDSIPAENPYGILGFAYRCEGDILYVSSVMGSARQEERGAIYAIDTKSKKLIDIIDGVDAFGLGISYISGKRVLYFGLARRSEIWQVTLDQSGAFAGKPSLAVSLEGLGPRGDDKARRIRFDKNNLMIVNAVEFNFNLTAPTEKQEFVSQFAYSEDSRTFVWRK